MSKSKQGLVIVAILLAGLYVLDGGPFRNGAAGESDAALEAAFSGERSGVQVEGEGTVTRILADDNEGGRHQRFIVRLASGQTLLVAHNVDLAKRIEGLAVGDRIGFYGQYEWNDRGGLIHWTHGDPQGRHVAGWIRHNGRLIE